MRASELLKKVLNKKSTHFITFWVRNRIIILDENRQVLIEDTIKAMIEHSKIEEAFKINEYFNNKYDNILKFFKKPDVLISVQDQVRMMQVSARRKPRGKYKKKEKCLLSEKKIDPEVTAYEAAIKSLNKRISNLNLAANAELNIDDNDVSFADPEIPQRKMTYTEVQIEKILVETKIKEIELSLKLKELIPKETAFKIYENLIFEVKANLRTVPSQIADRLLRLKTIPEIVETLTIAIDNVLIGLINGNDKQ